MAIPLRHGVFVVPFHSVGENPTLALERDLELMAPLDKLGFAAEHASHTCGNGRAARP